MFIHETKLEPNKKSSNQKHPDEHNREANGQNTPHEYKCINDNKTALERSVRNYLGGGGGLNRFYRALILALRLLIFTTKTIV